MPFNWWNYPAFDFGMTWVWNRLTHQAFLRRLARVWDYRFEARWFVLPRFILRVIQQPRWKAGRWRAKT